MKFLGFFIQMIKPILAKYAKNVSFLANFCAYVKKNAFLYIILDNVTDYLYLILSLMTKFI